MEGLTSSFQLRVPIAGANFFDRRVPLRWTATERACNGDAAPTAFPNIDSAYAAFTSFRLPPIDETSCIASACAAPVPVPVLDPTSRLLSVLHSCSYSTTPRPRSRPPLPLHARATETVESDPVPTYVLKAWHREDTAAFFQWDRGQHLVHWEYSRLGKLQSYTSYIAPRARSF